MPYVLGIDVGTSHTTAAISRLDEPAAGAVEIVRLSRSRSLASVLHLAEDGTVMAGDAAEARLAADPERIVRGFVRRVGDDVPVLVGGESYPAQELTAMLVRWVLDQVVGLEGGPPEQLVLTHPAGWGGYRRGLLHQELRVQGVGEVTLLPEPIAVGEQRAAEQDIEAGSTLAVYSLGDGVFSASVIRRVATGAFLLLARTESLEALGGAHFTDLLLGQVRAGLKTPAGDLDLVDPQARLACYRLRQACAQAKAQLSVAPEAMVPVALPTVQQQVRVTRGSFEELIRTGVTCTVDLLQRTVRAAAVAPAQVSELVLVGGSTRIPLVAELAGAASDGKDTVVVLDEAPELTVAKGAALAARRLATGQSAAPAEPKPAAGTTLVRPLGVAPIQIQLPAGRGEPDEFSAPPPRPSVDMPPLRLPEPRSVSQLVPGVSPGVLGVIVAIVVIAGVVLTFMLDGGGAGKTPASPIRNSGAGATPPAYSTSYPVTAGDVASGDLNELTTSSQGGGS
ncbi:MAG TPA: Hsp70 family protein [Pseudonocardiaceae bacterium]|nr:Hsp70 family protein [Pseudonocardiaceae bacterium]